MVFFLEAAQLLKVDKVYGKYFVSCSIVQGK